MKVTPENIAWAIEKLSVFSGLPGFPNNDKLLELHAISLLRVVDNRSIREIADERNSTLNDDTWKEWTDRTGIDPQQNDVEWLLCTMAECVDKYPFPRQIRSTYNSILTPADGKTSIEVPE